MGKSFIIKAPSTITYYGNSNEGIAQGGYNDPSNYSFHYVINCLFSHPDYKILGQMLKDSKNSVISTFTNNIRDENRWTFFSENMLGDPSVFIRKKKPQNKGGMILWKN